MSASARAAKMQYTCLSIAFELESGVTLLEQERSMVRRWVRTDGTPHKIRGHVLVCAVVWVGARCSGGSRSHAYPAGVLYALQAGVPV